MFLISPKKSYIQCHPLLSTKIGQIMSKRPWLWHGHECIHRFIIAFVLQFLICTLSMLKGFSKYRNRPRNVRKGKIARMGKSNFLAHLTCAYAWWTLMGRFPSVCLWLDQNSLDQSSLDQNSVHQLVSAKPCYIAIANCNSGRCALFTSSRIFSIVRSTGDNRFGSVFLFIHLSVSSHSRSVHEDHPQQWVESWECQIALFTDLIVLHVTKDFQPRNVIFNNTLVRKVALLYQS